MYRFKGPFTFILPGLFLGVLAACRPLDMYDQPKYEAYEVNEFFPDKRAMRLPPAGTRPQQTAFEELGLGEEQGAVTDFPFPLGLAELERGQQRFNIYCSPCHGYGGYGDGMIVQRGYTVPPSFHIERLRAAPRAYFYQVTKQGFGAMPSYRTLVSPKDRWLIVAYIQALQLSQDLALKDLTPAQRARLGRPQR